MLSVLVFMCDYIYSVCIAFTCIWLQVYGFISFAHLCAQICACECMCVCVCVCA